MFEHPVEPFISISAQLAYASVGSREFTGVGGYTNFAIPPNAPFYNALPDIQVGGVYATHPGLKTHADFELCVSGGCIRYLEFVTPDHEWPTDESQFTLFRHDPVA